MTSWFFGTLVLKAVRASRPSSCIRMCQRARIILESADQLSDE